MEIYLISTVVSFCAVFLKGFQHKNVIGGHLKMVAVTSYAMAVFDVATVMLIYKGGWLIALSAGTGAAVGMVAAILTHDRMFGTAKPSINKET